MTHDTRVISAAHRLWCAAMRSGSAPEIIRAAAQEFAAIRAEARREADAQVVKGRRGMG